MPYLERLSLHKLRERSDCGVALDTGYIFIYSKEQRSIKHVTKKVTSEKWKTRGI
jgi:hypothetical protein